MGRIGMIELGTTHASRGSGLRGFLMALVHSCLKIFRRSDPFDVEISLLDSVKELEEGICMSNKTGQLERIIAAQEATIIRQVREAEFLKAKVCELNMQVGAAEGNLSHAVAYVDQLREQMEIIHQGYLQKLHAKHTDDWGFQVPTPTTKDKKWEPS